MIFNEFLDFQWFSYVLHRFPNPFKLLLVSIVIFNVFCFHRFLMILICFSLFFQFTTSIWYRRRSAGLFVLPHGSFPTFNAGWHHDCQTNPSIMCSFKCTSETERVGKDPWGRKNRPADLRYQMDVVNSSGITVLPTMRVVNWPRITKLANDCQ